MSRTKELIGKPCDSCGFFDGGHLIGAGVAYCDRFKTWHYPNKRNFDCQDHIDKLSLEGAMKDLAQTIVWNRLAVEWLYGKNAGTPDDPAHASRSQAQLRAYKMAEGTGL